MSFVSFLQEKKSFPYPFLSRKKKTVGLRGKRSPLDGRTLAHPALSSVGIPQRVCLPPPPCLCPCPPRLRASFPVQTDHAKENHLRNSFPSLLLLLPSTCCTKRTVRMRTVRFSVPSRTCGKPPFLRKTPFPAVSFVSFLQEKKSFPYPFLSRKKRKKRKSIAEQLSFAAFAASVNMLHKTDGSHTNRPFFRSLCRTCGKPPFLRKTPFPAVSFVSFLQEKKTSPPFLKKRNRPPLLFARRAA